MNYEVLKDWRDDARSALRHKVERLQEEEQQISGLMQVLDATDELMTEIDDLQEKVERQQTEIDDLQEQLEQKDTEMAALRQQHQTEVDDLRRQLLEAKNHTLEAEANAKPTEIHNHFGAGSSSQVFNDKVNGQFPKKPKEKHEKKEKKRWKKIARRIL